MEQGDRTGFSDVDPSGRIQDLVEYLATAAKILATSRREAYEMLRLRRGGSILDVGCGTGEACLDLAGQVGAAGRVVGVDASGGMLAVSQRNAETAGISIDLSQASVYSLPFPDGTFDAVRAERLFQHLRDPESGLRELVRVTRSGGRVMVVDPDHGQNGIALDDACHARVFEAAMRALRRMITNPKSGTRMKPMFVRAGLLSVENRVSALELTYPDFVRLLALQQALDSALDAREVTLEQSRGFLAELGDRHSNGTFFGCLIEHRVAGTKP